MKKFLALFLSVLLVVSITGCGSSKKSSSDNTLVVYTSANEAILEKMEPAAEEATGLSIDFVSLASGEAYTKVVAERDNPQCDVLYAGGPAEIAQDYTLFEKYVSKHDSELPEMYQNKDGYCSMTNGNASVIIYNTDLCPVEITGYADLLKPELKGHIAFGNALESNSAYYHLENMLIDMSSDPEAITPDQKGWDYVTKFLAQLDGKIQDSSSAVYKGVASGEYWVGLTYDTGALSLISEGVKNVKIVCMKEGVILKTGGLGIVKNCPHLDNAKAFADYIQSKEWNEIYAQIPGTNVLRTDVEVNTENDIGLADAKQLDCGPLWTAAHKAEIVDEYQALLEKVNFGS